MRPGNMEAARNPKQLPHGAHFKQSPAPSVGAMRSRNAGMGDTSPAYDDPNLANRSELLGQATS